MRDTSPPFFPTREEVERLGAIGIENGEYRPDGSIVRFSFRYQRTRIFVAFTAAPALATTDDADAGVGLGSWRIVGNDIAAGGPVPAAVGDTPEAVRDRIIEQVESGRGATRKR